MNSERILDEREERNRVRSIYWAVVFIWAGFVYTLNLMNYLPIIGDADVRTYVALGAGLVGSIMNIAYVSSTESPNPTSWDWIWSGFWLVIGLGGFFEFEMFWPLTLILIGVIALVTSIRNR